MALKVINRDVKDGITRYSDYLMDMVWAGEISDREQRKLMSLLQDLDNLADYYTKGKIGDDEFVAGLVNLDKKYDFNTVSWFTDDILGNE